jgi:hypothetical protein
MKKRDELELQSLKVSQGWTVSHNRFYDLEPIEPLQVEAAINNNPWLFTFDESLLQITNEKRNITLDLGWYPPEEPDGAFGLRLIKDIDWENPLVSFDTRSKDEVVAKINELLIKVTTGEIK